MGIYNDEPKVYAIKTLQIEFDISLCLWKEPIHCTMEPQFYDGQFNDISIKWSTFYVLTKVTENCMEKNPDLTIFGRTVFPVIRWKSTDPSTKFFSSQKYN